MIGLFEVTPSERNESTRLRDSELSCSNPAGSGPLIDLVGQHFSPFIVAFRSRENDL
jgi:hypothetical protein